MTEPFINNFGVITVLLLGVLMLIVVHIVTYRIGKKKHMFDERQKYISTNAKAMSWNITTVVILIACALVIIFEGISLSFFIMTGIYVVHSMTLIFTSTYVANRN